VAIRKGEPWGQRGALPDESPVAHSDGEVRALVEAARRAGERPPTVGLLGGDLCRALGGRGDEPRLRGDDAVQLPIDIGSVLVDGRQFWFVAHLVARRRWWRGRLLAIMNVEGLGPWNVAPRAHPDDGLLDVIDADPPLADRLRARRRLPSGSHVPHPDIRVERTRAAQFDLAPALDVWLDGEPMGRTEHLSVRVEPDALTVVV
jgi:hypothetical protein